VTVADEAGSRVDSGWSPEIGARSTIGMGSLIAVLPVENLSGTRAPLEELSSVMRSKLSERGFRLVDSEVLEDFMARYRIRDTGGLHASVSQAIREEIGAEAYLVTSLEAYHEVNGPVVSMLSRLVLSGEDSVILWMDGVGLAGNAHPGFLGLGVIEDLDQLVDAATGCLADSLSRELRVPGDEVKTAAQRNVHFGCNARGHLVSLPADRSGRRIHRPRSLYQDPGISADRRYRVALIPFLNLSNRNNAGKLMALHFANQLTRTDAFSVVEPGLVREQLLRYRIIMQSGPSLANTQLISSKDSLGVDLIFSGTTFDYQDALGTPRVDFSLKIIDAKSRKIVWSSRSHNAGEDGVFFFDFGRIHTAHRLASEMTWETLNAIARGPRSPNVPRADPREAGHHPESSSLGTK